MVSFIMVLFLLHDFMIRFCKEREINFFFIVYAEMTIALIGMLFLIQSQLHIHPRPQNQNYDVHWKLRLRHLLHNDRLPGEQETCPAEKRVAPFSIDLVDRSWASDIFHTFPHSHLHRQKCHHLLRLRINLVSDHQSIRHTAFSVDCHRRQVLHQVPNWENIRYFFGSTKAWSRKTRRTPYPKSGSG